MDAATLASVLALLGILATVIVALTTLSVGRQTKNLAQATVDLGTQAARQVTEMETSRRLEWQPYLTFQPKGGDILAGDVKGYGATVTNVGRGPAINCLLVRFAVHEWSQSGLFELGLGQHEDLASPAQVTAMPTFMGQNPGLRTVLFCQDQEGTCHMFHPPERPQTSSSAADTAAWAIWYREQITPR